MKKNSLFILHIFIIIAFSCQPNVPLISDWNAYESEHASWQGKRLERLKTETGWLNLAGLYWLVEGENTFGSDSSNSIHFPADFPEFAGSINLSDSILSFKGVPETEIKLKGKSFIEGPLKHDQQDETSLMEYDHYRWYIIKRGEKYGIRLRNLRHPRLQSLDHIPTYPINRDAVVEAKYMKYDSLRMLKVPTVIENFYEEYEVPGKLIFKWEGKKKVLLPFKTASGFFLIIGDETNGIETYGAGRFLYIEHQEGERIVIDFNRAYNPPCAFSPFATCPIPPLENILDISINAGEKAVHLE